MRRLSFALVIVGAVIAIGAPAGSQAKPCTRSFTMHQFLSYARKAMPVPTKGQLNVMAIEAHCMWAPRLRAVARGWQRRHQIRLGEHRWASSTSYSSCESETTTAAGTGTFFGEVAQNDLALGTRIYMDYPVYGRRMFVVLDRIGSGSELDFFAPYCAWANEWGRRDVGYRVVR